MPSLPEAMTLLLEATTRLRRERILAPAVKKAEKQVGAAFSKQGREFVRRLSKAKARFAEAALSEETVKKPEWEPLFTAVELATLAAFEDPLGVLHRAALAAGIRVTLAEFSVQGSFDLPFPEAEAFLKGRAAERVAMINETTRSELKVLLTKAMEDGWSYDRAAMAIRDKFEGFAGRRPQKHIQSRAHLVAVTEAGDAYEEGSLQTVKKLSTAGLEMQKSWLTVGDSRVSAACRGNQGAGWIPAADAFPSGNDRPLAHPACRCTALYRRKPTTKEAE